MCRANGILNIIVLLALAGGCVSQPGPDAAAIGTGYDFSANQVRLGIEHWLEEHEVNVVLESLGDVDGEVVFITARGQKNIIIYEPYGQGQTFIQVIQKRADQPDGLYVDQDYVEGLQSQIVAYASQQQR